MNASKGKKKNKEEVHLYELSRDSKTLATINLKLDDFVHGRFQFCMPLSVAINKQLLSLRKRERERERKTLRESERERP